MDAGGAEVGSGRAEARLIQIDAGGEEQGGVGDLSEEDRRGGVGDGGDARPTAAARRASVGAGLIQIDAAGEEHGRVGDLRREDRRGGVGDGGDSRPTAAARRASVGVGDVERHTVPGAGRHAVEVDLCARCPVPAVCAIAAAAGRGGVPATGVGGGGGEVGEGVAGSGGEAASEQWHSDSDEEDGAASFSLDPYADEFVPETEPQDIEAMAMLSRPAGQSGGGDGVFAPNSGTEAGKLSGVVSSDAETEDENETKDANDPGLSQDLYWNDHELSVLRDCIPGFIGKPLKSKFK